MEQAPVLLTDAQMRHFIAHGYVLLQTDFPEDFHMAMNARIEAFMRDEGNPGNNILPRAPEVQAVFRHPVIRGAVSSVLGPDYIMQPHRHCHYTEPGRKVQSWHKDSYWGYARVRNHHAWWAMIFYYPQAVTHEMGPSGIIPGTQYYDKRPGDATERPLFLEGPAGTFVLIHYDLWHRGGANQSRQNRAMLKFQFTRMARPAKPTWANDEANWQSLNGQGPAHTHDALWAEHWQWLSGRSHSLARVNGAPQANAARLADKVQGEYEPDGVGAAYELAASGAEGLGRLGRLLETGAPHVSRRAAYGLSVASPEGLPILEANLHHEADVVRRFAVFALGEQGPVAQAYGPVVAGLLADEVPWVRRTAVETLGLLEDADVAVPALQRATADPDDQVRFSAALALARYGAQAAAAAPELARGLRDENRYVRGFSVEALRQIGTPEALALVCDHLMEARWCYSTTPDSTF